jgi:DNA repair protein RecO (recombination protein O)
VAKVAHGGYACELARELTPPHQPEPSLFDLLYELLDCLNRSEPRAELLRLYELKVLEAVGLRPVVDRCTRCDRVDGLDEPGQRFDVARGGVVCAECAPLGGSVGIALDGRVRSALAHAQPLGLADGESLHFPAEVNVGCRAALSAVIGGHLGRPLKSVEFIAKLNRASTGA